MRMAGTQLGMRAGAAGVPPRMKCLSAGVADSHYNNTPTISSAPFCAGQRTKESKERASRVHRRGRANFCLTCLVMLIIGLAFAGALLLRAGL